MLYIYINYNKLFNICIEKGVSYSKLNHNVRGTGLEIKSLRNAASNHQFQNPKFQILHYL